MSVLEEVLQIISYRKDVELSLQYESMHLVSEFFSATDAELSKEFALLVVELGMTVMIQLEMHGLYRNGRMSYAYAGRQGNDIVLVQTFYDNDHEPSTALPH